ncbi:unnamed protein product [Protopolystoma xenopodis]|uniref:Receptor ligand binding region domain-containing protein n=1 Tax=Protopolystoma xenopodis TaxID=117903 RepID=A0A448WC67_9PLAT|nr:unnamed protein product [Protopolystoma xenopodis]
MTERTLGKYDVCIGDLGKEEKSFSDVEFRQEFARIMNRTRAVNERRALRANNTPNAGALHGREVSLGVPILAKGNSSLSLMLPALDMALEHLLHTIPALNGVFFKALPIEMVQSMGCDDLSVSEQLENGNVDALIGPVEEYVLASTARYSASIYNIALFTPSGLGSAFERPEYSSLMTRTLLSYASLKWIYRLIFDRFNWKAGQATPIVLFTYPSSLSIVRQQCVSLRDALKESQYRLYEHTAPDPFHLFTIKPLRARGKRWQLPILVTWFSPFPHTD